MRPVTAGRAVAAALLLAAAFACAYGLVASSKPGPRSRTFAAGYAVTSLATAASAV